MKLNKKLSAKLQKSPKKGGWTYVVRPVIGEVFWNSWAGEGEGYFDGHPFRSSFMALGDGRHKLPVKEDIRKAIGKNVGDTVTISLEERLV